MTLLRGLLLLVLTPGLGNCGGGQDCDGAACANGVELTAPVPPTASSPWTITVCENTECVSAVLKPTEDAVSSSGLIILRANESGESRLKVGARTDSPSDGDQWSLSIVDEGGNAVFEGQQAVTYHKVGDEECGTCESASVTF